MKKILTQTFMTFSIPNFWSHMIICYSKIDSILSHVVAVSKLPSILICMEPITINSPIGEQRVGGRRTRRIRHFHSYQLECNQVIEKIDRNFLGRKTVKLSQRVCHLQLFKKVKILTRYQCMMETEINKSWICMHLIEQSHRQSIHKSHT